MLDSNRRTTRFAIAALSVAALAGCGDANIRKLTPGIARDSVLKILALGTASAGDTTPNVYREERYLHDGHWISILLYSNSGKKEGGADSLPENMLTPVVLRDDTLTGWGWEHHDSVALANNIAIKPRTK
jgi:hypothetical protein